MSKWYINTDLRDGKIYLAPFKVSDPPILLEVESLYQADQILKDLLIGKYTAPPETGHAFLYQEKFVSDDLGEVHIYRKK